MSARQLDLLGGDEPKDVEVSWARREGPGRIGRAAWPDGKGIGSLREQGATVLVAVGDAPDALLPSAKEIGIDVRHLASGDDAQLERHSLALANDLRAGRRVVVVSRDETKTAAPIVRALIALGATEAEAHAALGVELVGPPPIDDVPEESFDEDEPARLESVAPREMSPRAEAPRIEVPRMEAPRIEAQVEAPRGDIDQIARSPRKARIVGTVLGGAIGDAMGHPTEFVSSFAAIRDRFGPNGVEGYALFRERDGRRSAPYTDDTQMAECVLRSLLWGRERGADLDATMSDMAQRFVKWANEPEGGHRAPGNACLAGCRALERGVAWNMAGGETAGGCGSVMRAYPFGLVFAHDLERAESWSVAHSKLTHRDPIALAASAAMAIGIARTLRDEPIAHVLSEMVAAACRYSPKTAAMMARAIDEADGGVGPETTLERLQGWAAHEAIAAAMYVYARHPDDPRAAILEGANTPGDSDSIATLAGALCGARCGVGAIPSDWIRDVERSDELLALALTI
jgi:ADP-ribosylglycohydrolase